MVDTVVHRPFQPAVHVQHYVNVNQTRLQSSGHRLNDGTIVFTVASTDDQQFVVQLVLANHVIKDQLIPNVQQGSLLPARSNVDHITSATYFYAEQTISTPTA